VDPIVALPLILQFSGLLIERTRSNEFYVFRKTHSPQSVKKVLASFPSVVVGIKILDLYLFAVG
jgi:hypothetical protein